MNSDEGVLTYYLPIHYNTAHSTAQHSTVDRKSWRNANRKCPTDKRGKQNKKKAPCSAQAHGMISGEGRGARQDQCCLSSLAALFVHGPLSKTRYAALPTRRHHLPHQSINQSSNHPPRAPNHGHEHQKRQNPRPGPRTRRDDVLRERGIGRDAPAAAGRRVALARAAGLVGDGDADLVDQVGLDDGERAHLLADALRAVPLGALRPLHAAHLAVGAAGTLQRGGGGRGLDPWHYSAPDKRGVFHRGDEPAGEVGFEGVVVGVACVGGFAGDFVHDVWRVGGEEDGGGVEDAQDSLLPESGAVGL